jgi:hypothetical protein
MLISGIQVELGRFDANLVWRYVRHFSDQVCQLEREQQPRIAVRVGVIVAICTRGVCAQVAEATLVFVYSIRNVQQRF